MNQRDNFEKWMEDQGLKPKTIQNYLTSINTLSHRLGLNIYEYTDLEQISWLIEISFNNESETSKELNELNKVGNNMYSAGLKKYRNFVESNNAINSIKEKTGNKMKFSLRDSDSIRIASKKFTIKNYITIVNNNFIEKIKKRTENHNRIVKNVAHLLELSGFQIMEGNIDCFAIKNNIKLIIEVKSLDGTSSDEVKQVRQTYAQLDYYEEFALGRYEKESVYKIALFESKIIDEHIKFLQNRGQFVLWTDNSKIKGSNESLSLLRNLGIKI